ncbi:hypothetical protein [Microvirga sp. VF16]|uniref:hypothetical protein n=1 Tax=Microvirga sp. VF16 TaxID=2807101 RepID=UPI00193CBE47|nr:hypothetical protein [Microvirga sp. VF16]QRM32732.1 hypothetical protein JO965_25445 [Microvirga sp. VF16]
MSGIARQFEPQITRSGGTPSKYRFTVRCSDCANTDTYEASRPASHDAVRAYFKDRGWLLGRAASFDLCPACLARPRHAQEPVGQRRETKTLDKRHRETADILARHLGKPEELAAEIFRPKDAKPTQPSAPKEPAHSTPTLSPEVAQMLSGMAADLKGLRSAVELMAEQMSQLVALGGRQIETLAHLTPVLTRSAGGISDGLRQVARAIQSAPQLPQPVPDQLSVTEADAGISQSQPTDTEPAHVSDLEAHEPPRRARGRRNAKAETDQSEFANIVVKSIADSNGKDRFYTAIRLPRELWDRAGFGPDDRLLLDWSGKALSIERATDGGVKPKSIGGTSVVLQSWKLGNLNFDQPKVTNGEGSLRLTARPSGPK